jgi:ubiquinone/menaquinone biosynthesis C-methylase UbiE
MSLLDLAVCPLCHAAIERGAERWSCTGCAAEFPLEEGIRVLVRGGDDYKRRQANFFDEEVDDAYEIMRPRGTPALHEWLLREKFRRSIRAVSKELDGASVLTVCGGSGLDAEFLTATGARVLCTDISAGAAKRAAARATRFGLDFEVAVADAEALPFPDNTFDFAYVHDGLHHLEWPLKGVAEMARVSKRGVCITEPARAAITRLSVRFGVSTDEEDAGNTVARISAREVREVLTAAGFRAEATARYLMYYGHEPGLPSRVLSRPVSTAIAKTAFRAGNALLGRLGNKLTIQAVRP